MENSKQTEKESTFWIEKICPKCGSHNIDYSKAIPLVLYNYCCGDCGHIGKASSFYIPSKIKIISRDKIQCECGGFVYCSYGWHRMDKCDQNDMVCGECGVIYILKTQPDSKNYTLFRVTITEIDRLEIK